MFKALSRWWKYLAAAFSGKLDERADPKVQIEQAILEAKKQHELLSQQAASVLGNRRQLEMKLARQMDEVEKLQASARQALVLADSAKSAGDTAKASDYETTATAFASQLVSAEQSMEDLKGLHDQALESAENAKAAVEQNAYLLQQRLAERSKLLTQLEHAKMQEQMNSALKQVGELSVPGDVPTLNEVRDKIEKRYADALGQNELASTSVEARMLEVRKAAIDTAGAARLDQIRESMGVSAAPKAAAIEEKTAEATEA
ncbi:MAG: PspA/IM30 family protein [Mycobacteriales bacterium]